MTFNIGDKVKFVNDVGGGKVVGFSEGSLIIVESEDGFEMPVSPSELMFDTGNTYNKDAQPATRVNKPAARPSKPKVGYEQMKYQAFKGEVFLAIVPDNDKLLHVSNFNLYLVNNSNYHLQYLVSGGQGKVKSLLDNGEILPKKKRIVKTFNQTDISKIKAFYLQGIFFKPGDYDEVKPVTTEAVIDGISFYKANHFDNTSFFKQKAILFRKEEIDMKKAVEQLSESDVLKVIDTKEEKQKRENPKPQKESGVQEIDLHIEEIVDSHANLSNGEIVEIQLNRFETALNTAINAKQKKIVFIHGVGNGKLKHELRKKLDIKYGNLKYQDASFKEYGYGATLVNL